MGPVNICDPYMYCTVFCSVQYINVQCSTEYSTVQYIAVHCCTVQYNLQYSPNTNTLDSVSLLALSKCRAQSMLANSNPELYCIGLYSTVLHCIVPCYIVLYSIGLYSIVVCCTLLYKTEPHCTVQNQTIQYITKL